MWRDTKTSHYHPNKRTQDVVSKAVKRKEHKIGSAANDQRLRPFGGRNASRNSRSVDELPRSSTIVQHKDKWNENRARPEHIHFSQVMPGAETEVLGEYEHDSDVDIHQRRLTRSTMSRSRQSISNRRKHKNKTGNATVEMLGSDTDELSNDRFVTSTERARQAKLRELLKALVATNNAIDSIGGPEEMKRYLEMFLPQDSATAQIVQKHCARIAELLCLSGSVTGGNIPSTALLYNQLHVHRMSKNFISLVQPVDVFKTLPLYHRRKVFGFIRQSGLPLMYSLPGHKVCVEDHPKMLNSEEWTAEVKFWAKAHNIKFKTYIYDFLHKKKNFFASHAELRLIMWFAVDLKLKITGTQPATLREQIGDTFRLRTLTQGVRAEVVLSKAPCYSCLRFAATFEEYTGLKFTFTVIGNVGPLREGKDKHNFATLDGFASLSESEDSESDWETTLRKAVKYSQEKNNSMQVVIREKATTEVDVQLKANDRELQTRPHSHHLKRASFQPHIEDEEDSEFEPPGKKSKKAKRNSLPTTPTRPISGRNAAPPPSRDDLNDDPFGLEARAFAEQFKKSKPKKRKQEDAYPSPVSAKKTTRHKYFDY